MMKLDRSAGVKAVLEADAQLLAFEFAMKSSMVQQPNIIVAAFAGQLLPQRRLMNQPRY